MDCVRRFGQDGEYDPACCRWPKVCSPTVHLAAIAAGNVADDELEPLPEQIVSNISVQRLEFHQPQHPLMTVTPEPAGFGRVTIVGKDGQALVVFDQDAGTIDVRDETQLDEAAMHFVVALRNLLGAQPTAAPRWLLSELVEGSGTHDCPACNRGGPATTTGVLEDGRRCPLCGGWGTL